MALITTIKENDWPGLNRTLRKLSSLKLGPIASPTFTGLILTGLTASRLIATDGDDKLASVGNLASWIAGTANEIDVANDGDGTVTIGIVDPLIVGKGGIGVATLTNHGILLGSGTDAVTPLGVAADGQIPIGSAGINLVLAEITGTGNQVNVANAAGSITLSTPQDIHTGATPTFAGLTISTTGKIYFRDGDISIGSTMDGVLDINADNSIDMFYDNADVGDETDGQSLNINRRAGESDKYISLYVSKDEKGLIGFSGDDDLLQLTANALTVAGTVDATNVTGIAVGDTTAIKGESDTGRAGHFTRDNVNSTQPLVLLEHKAENDTTNLITASHFFGDVFELTYNGAIILSGGSITDTSGSISFGNEHLSGTGTLSFSTITSSGTIVAEHLRSTDDIEMLGHLLIMGDAGAAVDTVLSFLGSTNSAAITYDESENTFDFGGAFITTTGNISVTGATGMIDMSGATIPLGTGPFMKFSARACESIGSGFSRSGGEEFFNLVAGTDTRTLFGGGVDEDSYRRFTIAASGELQWGSGSAGRDVVLSRVSAGLLTFSVPATQALHTPFYIRNDTYTTGSVATLKMGVTASGGSSYGVAEIVAERTDSPNGSTSLIFKTASGNTLSEQVEIDSGGNVIINDGDLSVNGRVFSATVDITAGTYNNIDVAGVNTLFIDTSGGNVIIQGTINGVNGQVLNVVVHDATGNTTIENQNGVNQDFFLHAGTDEVMTAEYGGWVFVNDGGDHWHDCSHSKHV